MSTLRSLHAALRTRQDAAIGGPAPPVMTYRAVWISDLHLGTRACNTDLLLLFLAGMNTETIYLVGDIVDLWAMRSRFYWPASHRAVVASLLDHARRGTRVLYIPGNHDEDLRTRIGATFGKIEVAYDAIHCLADGRRLLVTHGDAFDVVAKGAPWLAHIGASAYMVTFAANRYLNGARRRLGLPYWSLSAFLKLRVKRAVNFISNYEAALVEAAKKRGVDGIICGHIHHADIRLVGDILYGNAGDWVESCTALVEHHDGRIELLSYAANGRSVDTYLPSK